MTSHVNEVDEAFAPPQENWVRVSPKLITARRITLGMGTLLEIAVLIALWLLPGIPMWVAAVATAVVVVVFIWAWWLIGRRVRSYGYAERADDLLVVSGLLVRRLVIVP